MLFGDILNQKLCFYNKYYSHSGIPYIGKRRLFHELKKGEDAWFLFGTKHKEVENQMVQLQEIDMSQMEHLLELRMFSYDILRRVFLAEPAKEFVQALQDGLIDDFPFREENREIKEGIEQILFYFKTFNLNQDFDDLHWDYTRMFIGPGRLPAPIWESSYTNKDGLLFQEETLAVRRFYLKHQLIPKAYRHEADDHLGLELDFMYQLSNRVLDSLKEENFAEIHELVKSQMSFLEEHLLNWTPMFKEKVMKSSNTDFYKGMVKILTGFLTIDKTCLQELLDNLKQ